MKNLPLLSRGFRPFFFGASVFAALSIALWLGVYRDEIALDMTGISASQWHAHELVFGFALAVIAGFLLTAAWNWTGRETASGTSLALIFIAWALARALLLPGSRLLWYAAAADLAFMLALLFVIARPILATRQSRQAPILMMLALLTLANLTFYLGAAGWLPHGTRIGIHLGLYLVLGMVLFMGTRLIPFFTERGVGYAVELRRSRWHDSIMFVLFPLYLLSELLLPGHPLGALLAASLLAVNSARVSGWYTLGIWKKPLLWGLFAAFLMINLGFLLRALAPVTTIPELLPIHAFAIGGIGTMALSMMARVSLGHTGRDVHQPPPVVSLILVGVLLSASFRVFLPLIDASHYGLWVGISAIAWVAAFALFTIRFAAMLVRSRADAVEG